MTPMQEMIVQRMEEEGYEANGAFLRVDNSGQEIVALKKPYRDGYIYQIVTPSAQTFPLSEIELIP